MARSKISSIWFGCPQLRHCRAPARYFYNMGIRNGSSTGSTAWRLLCLRLSAYCGLFSSWRGAKPHDFIRPLLAGLTLMRRPLDRQRNVVGRNRPPRKHFDVKHQFRALPLSYIERAVPLRLRCQARWRNSFAILRAHNPYPCHCAMMVSRVFSYSTQIITCR